MREEATLCIIVANYKGQIDIFNRRQLRWTVASVVWPLMGDRIKATGIVEGRRLKTKSGFHTWRADVQICVVRRERICSFTMDFSMCLMSIVVIG